MKAEFKDIRTIRLTAESDEEGIILRSLAGKKLSDIPKFDITDGMGGKTTKMTIAFSRNPEVT